MTAQAPLVSLNHLVCQAGATTLLDVPQLRIAPGERVALIGHNGAGKSTLLRCLSGFVRPVRGEVQVLGRTLGTGGGAGLAPLALRQLRCEIGQVMQGLHLVQRVSALDNVLMGLLGARPGWRSWVRLHTRADVALAEAALCRVGMLARADVRVDALSGGERQKVAIARMLMQRPRLILADEPTASLDPLAAAEVCTLLADAAANAPGPGAGPAAQGRVTLITVVHNPSLLPILADRVIGLKGGRIEFDLALPEVNDARLASLYRPREADAAVPWGASGAVRGGVALDVPAEAPVMHTTTTLTP